jgi:hypothetical protein
MAITPRQEPDYDKIMADLAEPFPPELLKVNKAKGGLTYVPVAEVIARLNRVLGVTGWNTQVVDTWREPDHADWVLARVKLTVYIGDRTVEREGVGGQQVKYRKTGDVVDLGDEYKGAVSDALKKAAQSLGVALDLARSEEALAYDDAIYESLPPAEPSPSAGLFGVLKEHLGTMNAESKEAFKAWWAETYTDERSPGTGTDVQRLNDAIARAVAIKLGADSVGPVTRDGEPMEDAA